MSLLSTGVAGLPHSLVSRAPGWVRRRVVQWRLLADDLDAHRPCGALDHPGCGLEIVGWQVGHLDVGDVADLVAGHAPDGLALRGSRALVDAGSLAEQVRGGRSLEDERERAVLVD